MSLSADSFMIVLSDSLFVHHADESLGEDSGIVMGHQVQDAYGVCEVLLCVASGAGLIMPSADGFSALQLFDEALDDEDIGRRLSDDLAVRVLVVNPAMSTAECRRAGEQFPQMVSDRSNLPLHTDHAIPWTICDLEDCIMDRPQRNIFPVLESCELQSRAGIYDAEDVLHFDARVGVSAGDELLLAVRRQAMQQYEGQLQSSILLVLAAGWNAEGLRDESGDGGPCWRKAELVTSLELCAMSGQPLSAFRDQVQYLLQRAEGDHREEFVRVPAMSILPVEPGTTAPRGGYGGQRFDDRNASGIKAIAVRKVHEDGAMVLRCIETHHADGSVFRAGLEDGLVQTFDIPAGRTVKTVWVCAGRRVDAISFALDDGTESEWLGSESGEVHCLFEAAEGQCVTGFHGRAGGLVSSVGVRFSARCSRRRGAGSQEDLPPPSRRRLAEREAAASPGAVGDAALAQLLEMGFDASRAGAALLQCAGDIEGAVALLCR